MSPIGPLVCAFGPLRRAGPCALESGLLRIVGVGYLQETKSWGGVTPGGAPVVAPVAEVRREYPRKKKTGPMVTSSPFFFFFCAALVTGIRFLAYTPHPFALSASEM